jgi:hypothetical protein
MYSIYHLFKNLDDQKGTFPSLPKLEDFPFQENMLSCRNKGIFPDLAIKINPSNELFSGGELIELKDSKFYTVTSFNSTIPTSKKDVKELTRGNNNRIRKQMLAAGEDIEQLPLRDVFYLIRGKNQGNVKVALVQGSFFETVRTQDLIGQSFIQAFKEKSGVSDLPPNVENLLKKLFSEQDTFSKVRHVNNASVKLRFRIMTEVTPEGNILNPTIYPEITDNSLNLVLPCYTPKDRELAEYKMSIVFGPAVLERFRTFLIQHPFNGQFLVFQTSIS